MKWHMHWIAAAAAVALMTACGGGGSGPEFTSVKVAGDSLADSGTFGAKFTVQGSAPMGANSSAIWPEIIAAKYETTLCPHYMGMGFESNPYCGNYAIAGGRINNFADPLSPVSILTQLSDMGADGFSERDLVLIDGGGNDAADLIGAFLKLQQDQGAALQALLGTYLDPASIQALLANGAQGAALAGGLYMKALATHFAQAIDEHVVDRGAERVVVLNMPDVTLTPKLGFILGQLDEATAAQLRGIFGSWVQAFNATLAEAFKDDENVTVADFAATLNDQVTNPAKYGLTNVSTPACPVTGADASGPTYDLPTCTAAGLSATTPPDGATGGADWWKTYIFSDNFHPTPYGHELLADLVAKALDR